MNTTLSPIAFNGRLDDALKAKDDLLSAKERFLEASTDADYRTVDVFESMAANAALLRQQQDETLADALDVFSKEMIKANVNQHNTGSDIQKSFLTGNMEAQDALNQARAEAQQLAQSLQAVAEENELKAQKVRKEINEVEDTARPLSSAALALLKPEIDAAEVTTESAKKAMESVQSAADAVMNALEEIANIQNDLHETMKDYNETARQKTLEANDTLVSKNDEAQTVYNARMAELNENKAQALDAASKTAQKAIDEAKAILDEAKAGIVDIEEKADVKGLEEHIKNMEKANRRIMVQSFITRAKNLPVLAATTVGLGATASGVTEFVVHRIMKVLNRADKNILMDNVQAKLAAADAAKVFLQEGSPVQKTLMAAALELGAFDVAQKTNNLDVVRSLKGLATSVNEVI